MWQKEIITIIIYKCSYVAKISIRATYQGRGACDWRMCGQAVQLCKACNRLSRSGLHGQGSWLYKQSRHNPHVQVTSGMSAVVIALTCNINDFKEDYM